MSEPAQPSNHKQYLIIVVLAIFILATWLATKFINQSTPQNQPGISQAGNCDIQNQSCKVNFGDTKLTLDVQPKQFSSMTPLSYKVTVAGANAESVTLDLQGVEMFMGLNQTQLEQVTGTKDQFSGSGELGACVTGEMMWRATVITETDKGQLKTWFDFPAR